MFCMSSAAPMTPCSRASARKDVATSKRPSRKRCMIMVFAMCDSHPAIALDSEGRGLCGNNCIWKKRMSVSTTKNQESLSVCVCPTHFV